MLGFLMMRDFRKKRDPVLQMRLLAPFVCMAAVPLLGLASADSARAQVSVPAPALERVIGEVTATDSAARQMTVKLDAGGTVTVILQDGTLYLRVPPGERDIKKAVKITAAEIGVGDRVYARGPLAEDQKSLPAVAVIVMTKADLAQKRERERAEWQKRGVGGTIAALRPESKEITLAVRSREGTKTMIIESSPTVVFRRYAPDSVRLGQAQPSSFAELKVGDALRIIGTKNSDSTRIKPEEIVSGSFRTIAGIVTTIAAGEIGITDLQNRKPLTVRITSDSLVRRMPQTKAAATGGRPPEGGRGTAAAGGAGSGGRPIEGPANRPSEGGRGAAAAAGSAGSGARPTEGPPQGAPPGKAPEREARTSPPGPPAASDTGGGQLDPERMPVLSVGQLKQGEAVLIMCTVGAEPSRVTAIVMVAGIESLLSPGPDGQTQVGGLWNFFDVSLP